VTAEAESKGGSVHGDGGPEAGGDFVITMTLRDVPGGGRGQTCRRDLACGTVLYCESPAFITVPLDCKRACGYCATPLVPLAPSTVWRRGKKQRARQTRTGKPAGVATEASVDLDDDPTLDTKRKPRSGDGGDRGGQRSSPTRGGQRSGPKGGGQRSSPTRGGGAVATADAIVCRKCTHEFYCAEKCRAAAWTAHHAVVCGHSPATFRKEAAKIGGADGYGLHLAVERLMCKQLSHPAIATFEKAPSSSLSSASSSAAANSAPPPPPPPSSSFGSSTSSAPLPSPSSAGASVATGRVKTGVTDKRACHLDRLFPDFEALSSGGAGRLDRSKFAALLRHLRAYVKTRDERFTVDWYLEAYDRLQRNAFVVMQHSDQGMRDDVATGGDGEGDETERTARAGARNGDDGGSVAETKTEASISKPAAAAAVAAAVAAAATKKVALAYACYARHSHIRHSCDPNVELRADGRLTAVRAVKAGEPLLIAKCDPRLDINGRAIDLAQRFGVMCRCTRCRAEAGALTPDTKFRIRARLDARRNAQLEF
jgi:hypothetical protein